MISFEEEVVLRIKKIFVNPLVLLKGFFLALYGRLALTSLLIDTERFSLEMVVVTRSSCACFDLRRDKKKSQILLCLRLPPLWPSPFFYSAANKQPTQLNSSLLSVLCRETTCTIIKAAILRIFAQCFHVLVKN